MNKKLKILHLSSALSWRGGEQQIAYLIKETRLAGVDSHLICKKKSLIADWCLNENIPFYEINFRNAYDLFDAIRIKQYFEKNKFDILHLHTSKSHTIGVIASILGLNAPIILTRRVDIPVKRNWFSRYKYNFSSIKKIVCISNEVKRIISPSITDHQKLTVIYSGIDIDRPMEFSTDLNLLYQIPEDKIVVGNTSALEEQKDYPTFIDTAEILIRQNNAFHFVIFGSGSLKDEIENTIKSKKLEAFFTLPGFKQEVQHMLPQFDYFLITSKKEGLGTSILDAFAAGVPVIATNAGGIPEIVIDRATGLLAKIGDSMSLAQNILELHGNIELKTSIIHRAKDFVLNFSKEKCAEQYISLYRSNLFR
ncbi:MAG: glycosyltransferase family 4 protein [Cyclobacteriaceae bacterium]